MLALTIGLLATAATPGPESFTVISGTRGAGAVEVAVLDDRTVVHRSTNAQGIPSNGLIAVGPRGLLLVDTAWTDAQTPHPGRRAGPDRRQARGARCPRCVRALHGQARRVRGPARVRGLLPGAGHTSDNIVLAFPDVLFGGCLIKSTEAKDLGNTADANLAAWPASVRSVAARYPRMTVVPGHGPVDHTGRAPQHTLDVLAARH